MPSSMPGRTSIAACNKLRVNPAFAIKSGLVRPRISISRFSWVLVASRIEINAVVRSSFTSDSEYL